MIGLVEPAPKAASVNFIDESGIIFELARFGLTRKDPFLNRNSIWADLPPFKLLLKGEVALIDPAHVAEKSKAAGFEIEPEPWLKSVLLIPIFKKQTPVGAVALFFDQRLTSIPRLEIDYQSFQALMVLALETSQFQRAIMENARPDLPELTDAERDFINWIARGYSNKQIAQETKLALPTVKARVSKLLSRFEVKNRKELVQKLRSDKTF
jgi:DNA-binding CsgD family transcriptional regulator